MIITEADLVSQEQLLERVQTESAHDAYQRMAHPAAIARPFSDGGESGGSGNEKKGKGKEWKEKGWGRKEKIRERWEEGRRE